MITLTSDMGIGEVKGMHLVAYTDGGCKDGKGGVGLHAYAHDKSVPTKRIHKAPSIEGYGKEGSALVQPALYIDIDAGMKDTTNNQMELDAIYTALKLAQYIEAPTLIIHTDSEYSKNALTKWAKGWEAAGWLRPDGTPVKNKDLLIKIYTFYKEMKSKIKLKIVKVKAHNGDYGNEKADSLATKGRLRFGDTKGIGHVDVSASAEATLPKVVGGGKEEMHDIFSKVYLYINTNLSDAQRVNKDGKWVYYMGRHTGRKTKIANDPDVFLGKPTADHSYAVIFMDEKEPVIEALTNTVASYRSRSGFSGHELCVLDLSKVKRAPVYRRHFTPTGMLTEMVDNRRLVTHDNIELMRVVQPMMVAYAVGNYFNGLEALLHDYKNPANKNIMVQDITADLYDVSVNGKGVNVYKVKEEMKPGWRGKVYDFSYPVDGKPRDGRVNILADMDLPDRNTLARIAGPDTKVSLVIYPEDGLSVRYACVVECVGATAIYSSVHSNRIVLKGGG